MSATPVSCTSGGTLRGRGGATDAPPVGVIYYNGRTELKGQLRKVNAGWICSETTAGEVIIPREVILAVRVERAPSREKK